MVHINPKVNLGFPSVMSSFLMLTSFTCHGKRKTQTKLKHMSQMHAALHRCNYKGCITHFPSLLCWVFSVLKSGKELHSGCKQHTRSHPAPPTPSWEDASAVTMPADPLPVPNTLALSPSQRGKRQQEYDELELCCYQSQAMLRPGKLSTPFFPTTFSCTKATIQQQENRPAITQQPGLIKPGV